MKLKVRFPNESHYDEIDFDRLKDFRPEKEIDDSMFGWWGDVYVEVLKIEKEGNFINPFMRGTIKIDAFTVEYHIEKSEFESLFDLYIDDILVGETSVKESLNSNFNIYKSLFRRRLIELTEARHPSTKYFLNLRGGLAGYFED